MADDSVVVSQDPIVTGADPKSLLDEIRRAIYPSHIFEDLIALTSQDGLVLNLLEPIPSHDGAFPDVGVLRKTMDGVMVIDDLTIDEMIVVTVGELFPLYVLEEDDAEDPGECVCHGRTSGECQGHTCFEVFSSVSGQFKVEVPAMYLLLH